MLTPDFVRNPCGELYLQLLHFNFGPDFFGSAADALDIRKPEHFHGGSAFFRQVLKKVKLTASSTNAQYYLVRCMCGFPV